MPEFTDSTTNTPPPPRPLAALHWARDITAHLDGPGWRAVPDSIGSPGLANLHGPDGIEIAVHTDTTPGRVVLSWWMPAELTEHRPADAARRAEITLSTAKGPDRAGREITRRLLPTITGALAAARERETRADAEQARRHTLRDQITTILATSRYGAERGPDTDRTGFGLYGHTPWGHFEVHSSTLIGEDVELHARLNHHEALAVARLLATLHHPNPNPETEGVER